MSTAARIQVIRLDQIPSNSQFADGAKQPLVVLVVDDERVIADTLSIILSKSGYAVQTAYSASAALDLAAVIPPHVLLSDVMMGPGMDGTQLAMELIRSQPDCKVVLFSGHAATQDLLEKAREMGHSFTLLSKPLHPADLLAHLQACLVPVSAAATA